jgi:hypothetical protein
MANETVKYSNELNELVMDRWTKDEMNLFFSILAWLKDGKGSNMIAMGEADLRRLSKIRTKDPAQFKASVHRLSEKLQQLSFWTEEKDVLSPFSGKKRRTMTVRSVFNSMEVFDGEGSSIEGVTVEVNKELYDI